MKRTTFASVAALCALPMLAWPAYAQTGSDTGTSGSASQDTGAPETDNSTYGVDAEAGGETAAPGDATSPGAGTTTGNSTTDGMGTGATAGTGSADSAGSDSTGTAPGTSAEPGATDQAQSGDPAQGDADPLIATVGGEEIKASDVRDAIAMLPPQIRQNSPEMVVPFAVEQLVMRKLVLQKAAEENLSEDEEVTTLAGSDDPSAVENATLQVYVRREMEGVATDEAVQSAYDALSAESDTPLPPLEDVRPQIEQQLQQQKLIEVRDDLKEEFEVVYYGPDGQPREATATTDGAATGGTGTTGSDSSGEMSGGGGSGENSGMSGSGGSGGGSDTSGSGGSGGGSDTSGSGRSDMSGDDSNSTTGSDTGN